MTDKQESLDKETVEADYDPFDKLGKFLGQWQERFTFSAPRMFERYADGVFLAVLVLRLRGILEEYVAVFNAVSKAGGHGSDRNLNRHRTRAGRTVGSSCRSKGTLNSRDGLSVLGNCPDDKQEVVLVGNVECMENAQRIVPSYVWLQPLDRFASGLADCLFYTSKATFERVGVVSDGKDVVARNRRLSTVMARKFAEQNVEGGSEIMSQVPKDQGDGHGNLYIYPLPTDEFPVRVLLGNDAYGVRVFGNKGSDSIVKISKVFLGPINFCPGGPQWVGSHE